MRHLLFVILLITLVLSSCKEAQQLQTQTKTTKFSYPETVIPTDTTKLWIGEGLKEKDTVFIISPGGPKDTMKFEKTGKSSWRYLKNYEHYYKVHLHQANTLNPKFFEYAGELTLDMAKKEAENSSEMLFRAITYFKKKDKVVYVLGHSYGAYVTQHYLATKPSLADRYIIISGRIDDPEDVQKIHIKGFSGFYENGITFKSEEDRDFRDYNAADMKYYTGKQLLKAAYGAMSYSETLKDVDLSNTIYIYSINDEQVGRLTQNELTFLKNKGVPVFTSEREHGYTIRDFIDLVDEGKIKL